MKKKLLVIGAGALQKSINVGAAMTCPKCGTETKPSPDNPWCEACDEKDCLIGGDDYCEMIRVYKKRKESLKDIKF